MQLPKPNCQASKSIFVTFHPKQTRPGYKPNICLYLTMREIKMLLLDLRIILILSNSHPKNDSRKQ